MPTISDLSRDNLWQIAKLQNEAEREKWWWSLAPEERANENTEWPLDTEDFYQQLLDALDES
jgi:hypothetical protein